MNANRQLELLQRAANGNAGALDFLKVWTTYVHRIDDVVDEMPTPDEIVLAFVTAHALYNTPFYMQHRVDLAPMVLLIADSYAQANAWEKGPEDWQRGFADHARHHGALMILAVAQLTGGWKLRRELAPEIIEFHYHETGNEE